jgi:hypothetical protein
MIAHIVLYRPKADLPPGARGGVLDALRAAHRRIPQIRRFAVGMRVKNGSPYEAGARDFPFIALLEFDTAADLAGYLTHPAHETLGLAFYQTSEAAEAYDFTMEEMPDGVDRLMI